MNGGTLSCAAAVQWRPTRQTSRRRQFVPQWGTERNYDIVQADLDWTVSHNTVVSKTWTVVVLIMLLQCSRHIISTFQVMLLSDNSTTWLIAPLGTYSAQKPLPWQKPHTFRSRASMTVSPLISRLSLPPFVAEACVSFKRSLPLTKHAGFSRWPFIDRAWDIARTDGYNRQSGVDKWMVDASCFDSLLRNAK